MISKVALLGILLLATSALADHTSQPEATLARRAELCTIEPNKIHWNSNSSGSLLNGQPFNNIAATFTIPTLKGSDGAVSIGVGFDTGCESASFGVAIQGNIVGGEVSWNAWAQWVPNPRVDLNVTMRAGDTITVTVSVFSQKTGVVLWWNHQGAIVTQGFDTNDPLCMNYAGWEVGAVMDLTGSLHPVANFDTVTFMNAMVNALGSNYTYFPCGPSWYTIYGIEQNGRRITNVTSLGTTLTVEHL